MEEVRRQLRRRLATSDDTEFARRAHHAAYRDVVERQFGSWDDDQQDRFFAGDWSGATFEVLEWDGQPCGYVSVEDRPDDVHVRELVLVPSHQGLGIGTAVLDDAIALARQRGVPVLLGALHENRAVGLYRRLGFHEFARTETHTLFRLDPTARERHTARLHLRPIASEDQDAFVAIHVDPRTYVHSPQGPHDWERAEAMLASIVDSWSRSGMSYWSVVLDGAVIGFAGVERHEILGRDCWNLYYRFAPHSWGNGYATEAAREAVAAAQAVEPARPIVARTRATNAGAIGVAERVGLERRSDLDHEGFVVFVTRW